RLCSITLAAGGEVSTKYACLAPRLSASIPTAPVPAKRSNHTVPASASGLPAVSTLNKVSRNRSEVGRMSAPRNDRKGRPRYLPAITRMALYLRGRSQYIRPCKITVAAEFVVAERGTQI